MLKYTEDSLNCAFVESDHIRGYLIHDNDKTTWALYASAQHYYGGSIPVKCFQHDGSDDFEERVVDRWLEYGDAPIFFDKSIDACSTKTGVITHAADEGTWVWVCDKTGSEITSSNRNFMIKTLRALGEIV
jgi:hypothetical protein